MPRAPDNELPATGARSLTPLMRAAILAAAAGGLQRTARWWYAPGHPAPILDGTVEALRSRGLLLVRKRSAPLTETGKWYARTIAANAAGKPAQATR